MANYSVHGEISAITDHACKAFRSIIVCADNKTLVDDLLRATCKAAIEDLSTIPHFITQFQTGKNSSVTPRRTINNRQSHNILYTKKKEGKKSCRIKT